MLVTLLISLAPGPHWCRKVRWKVGAEKDQCGAALYAPHPLLHVQGEALVSCDRTSSQDLASAFTAQWGWWSLQTVTLQVCFCFGRRLSYCRA